MGCCTLDPAPDSARAAQEPDDPAGHARERVTQRGQRRAQGKDRPAPELFRQAGRRNLEGRHRAAVESAHQGEGGVAHGKFRAPHRQQHVDQVGVTVVERVREAANREHASGERLSAAHWHHELARLHAHVNPSSSGGVAATGRPYRGERVFRSGV